ncbi:MAG: hypothetical protein PHG27_05155 [Massilibacteroides sp.]|nr:hypothetical protein [Massilibacteroides sp.]
MWNLKEFEVVYSRYQSSHLRVKDFCRNECISLSRFFYWQKKLKQDRKELEQPSGFIPLLLNSSGSSVKHSPDYPHLSNSRSGAEAICELIYPNGVRLRLLQGTDIRELEQLIHLYR